jgi:hypothetical protein
MSQTPVPPRYPPKPSQQPPQPQAQPQPAMPQYPQTAQEGYLVNVPGQPQPAQPVPYYNPLAQHQGGVWNYGGVLVMHKQAQLPPQCIKCCAPAEGKPLKRKITWHPSWVYILILPGILIYAIVALAIQEKATVYVGLCEKHRARRRMHLWIAWGIFFASIACFFMAANAPRNAEGFWAMAGVFGILIALIYAVINSRLIMPTKIDAQYAWLKGFCPQYVNQFPSMQQGF